MNIKKIRLLISKNNIYVLFYILVLVSCTVSPGMQNPYKPSYSKNYFLLPDPSQEINIVDLGYEELENLNKNNQESSYSISSGDVLNIVVWGLPEFFSTQSYMNPESPYSTRLVDENGNIFFPYAGVINVKGKKISEVRTIITEKLNLEFNDPQVDVSISKYNKNRNVYIVGEVIKPSSMTIGIEDITLADLIANAKGLKSETSDPKDIYIIRTAEKNPVIYRVNLRTPDKFILAKNIKLRQQDIVYVGSANITSWNRTISQLFPFTSLVRQIDQIEE